MLELLGFPLNVSHFDLLETGLRGEVMANDLVSDVRKVVKMEGQYVTEQGAYEKQPNYVVRELPGCGEDFFQYSTLPKYMPMYPFRGAGCCLIGGKVVEE